MNNPWLKWKKYQYHVKIMHNGIVNKIRYDDPGKLMKQTSFTVKNLGGNLPKNQSTIERKISDLVQNLYP